MRKGGSAPNPRSVTWRAILIALLLGPLNCYWVIQIEIVWYSGHPTCASIFYNVVFSLLVVVLLNLAVRRFFPSVALTPGELLTIYVMIGIMSTIASHDMLQILIPSIPHVFRFATPENEWQTLIQPHLPTWLTIRDTQVMDGYYDGGVSLFTRHNLLAWMGPMLWWGGFIFVLLFVMLCINAIVRKAWTEDEKLSYPIIQVPLALSDEKGAAGLFRNPVMWAAFALAGGIDLINGLNHFFPSIPVIPVKFSQLGTVFTQKPWNAIGRLPWPLYPFAVGLAFFLPLDLCFSIWFFYLFRKGQQVLAAAAGLRNLPGFPYLNEQSSGAWIGLAALAIWISRRHLGQVIRTALAATPDRKEIDESREPMPYRWAIGGFVVGVLALVGFSVQAGMSLWSAVLFFAIYLGISTAIARMRAELGPPTHELTPMNAEHILVDIFGSRRLGAPSLTIMTIYWFFNRSYRNHPMPVQLEAYKMAERARMDNRRLSWAILLAVVVAVPASFASLLHMSYNTNTAPGYWFGYETFNRLTGRLMSPTDPDLPAIFFLAVGFVFTFFLMAMRMQFLWWPLHPAGYALSTNFGIDYIWFCLVIASIAKAAILRYGGLKALQRATPFFLGLILGEFTIGSFWSALSVIMQEQTYTFWIF
ncbi:hypothetical protein FJZ36_02290 [Candidatus Poribacteria bacterium]|nr:hypothetical protein [Candidatus Poribacteria bacterium]